MPQHNTDSKKILLVIFCELNNAKKNNLTKNYEKINNNLKNSLNYINKLKQNEINEEEKILLIRNISNIINDSSN